MAAMIIRKADSKDISGIAKVHVDSWRTTYKGIVPDTYLNNLTYESREQIWKRGIETNHVYIAEDEYGQIVGFATGGEERTGKYEKYKGELYAIYLLEEQQGKGLGQKLFKSVVDDLKDKRLNSMVIWALEENPACLFYERLGGKKIDEAEIEIDGRKLGEIAFGWDDLSGSGIFVKDGINEKVEKNS
jgi:GNAT superfamily N-acetyltransferase